MQQFGEIDEGQALVRSRGILKIVNLYARGQRVYIPHAGGFIRLCDKLGDEWTTTIPHIKVLEHSGVNVEGNKAPTP